MVSPSPPLLRVPGETLGPAPWSGQQRRVGVASLLEGAALVLGDSRPLKRGGNIAEGAAVTEHHRLRQSAVWLPLYLFLFFWACLAVAPALFFVRSHVRCGCFIYKAGRKPISRREQASAGFVGW